MDVCRCRVRIIPEEDPQDPENTINVAHLFIDYKIRSANGNVYAKRSAEIAMTAPQKSTLLSLVRAKIDDVNLNVLGFTAEELEGEPE
jgi:hypothetical protein